MGGIEAGYLQARGTHKTVSWTRLEKSLIWELARKQYDANGLAYHGFSHILRIYTHAAALDIPHDPALDLAILTHDVVHDEDLRLEFRSARWMMAAAADTGLVPSFCSRQDIDRAWAFILSTGEHTPRETGNAMLILDLADFRHAALRETGLARLREEYIGTHGSPDGFVSGTLAYLSGLAERIDANLHLVADPGEASLLRDIHDGIRSQIGVLSVPGA